MPRLIVLNCPGAEDDDGDGGRTSSCASLGQHIVEGMGDTSYPSSLSPIDDTCDEYDRCDMYDNHDISAISSRSAITESDYLSDITHSQSQCHAPSRFLSGSLLNPKCPSFVGVIDLDTPPCERPILRFWHCSHTTPSDDPLVSHCS
jgi:hypothetical protein